MKIKIAIEFETEIEEYSDQKLDVAKNKIINAVNAEHKNIIPTGEWCFITDKDTEYVDGVFY